VCEFERPKKWMTTFKAFGEERASAKKGDDSLLHVLSKDPSFFFQRNATKVEKKKELLAV
jgi:hypothetical protein